MFGVSEVFFDFRKFGCNNNSRHHLPKRVCQSLGRLDSLGFHTDPVAQPNLFQHVTHLAWGTTNAFTVTLKPFNCIQPWTMRVIPIMHTPMMVIPMKSEALCLTINGLLYTVHSARYDYNVTLMSNMFWFYEIFKYIHRQRRWPRDIKHPWSSGWSETIYWWTIFFSFWSCMAHFSIQHAWYPSFINLFIYIFLLEKLIQVNNWMLFNSKSIFCMNYISCLIPPKMHNKSLTAEKISTHL